MTDYKFNQNAAGPTLTNSVLNIPTIRIPTFIPDISDHQEGGIMKSIEWHYNKRYELVRVLTENIRELTDGHPNIKDFDAKREFCETLNKISIEQWPEVRRSLAEYGGELPLGPLRYSVGKTDDIKTLSSFNLYRDRDWHHSKLESQHLDMARKLLIPEWRKKLEIAKESFEEVRALVANGASEPPEGWEET